jgi:hypothetical protein
MCRLIYFIVEGKTEGKFVEELLSNYLIEYNITVNYMILYGNINFDRLRNEITNILKRKYYWKITTMIDLYGLKNPEKFPGYNEKSENYDLVEKLESGLKNFFNDRRFIPYFSLHEFEALLFSDVNIFKEIPDININNDQITALSNKLEEYKSNPELINQNNGPSKHIIDIISRYNKVVHGKELCEKIGIDTIRKNCKHFNEWIEKLIQ